MDNGSARTVAVTGATGFVGRYVVRELLRRGYSVRALGRSREVAREAFAGVLAGAGPMRDVGAAERSLVFIEGDVLAAGVLDELVRGTFACVHLVGIIREVEGQTFQRMHVEATQAVVDACKRAEVGRFLHMSALGAGPEGPAAYQKTKWAGEQVVRRSGLAWTIFRPSIIHGAESEFVQMVKGMCSGQEAPWFFLPYFSRPVVDRSTLLGAVRYESASVQPIAVEDVAAAFATALQRPQTIGELINLVGPDVLDWPHLLRTLRDKAPSCSSKLDVWHMPGTHGAMLARAARALGLGGLLPFDAGQALMAMQDSTADAAKMHKLLDLRPRGFHEAVDTYAARV